MKRTRCLLEKSSEKLPKCSLELIVSNPTSDLPLQKGGETMVQAFLAAGARSVLSTLWPIDDDATRSL